MYDIDWKSKASKQLAKIDGKATRDEIYDTVQTLCNFPDVPQIKKLTNHQYDYRLRVGRYRIFFDIEDVIRIIYIEEVKKRDDRTY